MGQLALVAIIPAHLVRLAVVVIKTQLYITPEKQPTTRKLLVAVALQMFTRLAGVISLETHTALREMLRRLRGSAAMQTAPSWLAIMPKHASATSTLMRTHTMRQLAETQTIPTTPPLAETQNIPITHLRLTIAITLPRLREINIGTMETSYRTHQYQET
jgi:hypothetical protein